MKKSLLICISAAVLACLCANSMAGQKVKSIEFVNKTPVNFICNTYNEGFLGTKAKITLATNKTGNIGKVDAHESWSCQPLVKKGYLTYSAISKFSGSKPGALQVTLTPTT